jgi:hypothetical protein
VDSSTGVWASSVRTLSTYGTLVADITTAVWGATTRTLSSFGTLVSSIWSNVVRTLTSGGGASAEDVWEYESRTLTQGAEEVNAVVTGGDLTIYKYATIDFSLTVGELVDYDDVWFTIKKNRNDADADSVALVGEEDGLIYLWKETAPTPADASLTVTTEATGVIQIRFELDAAAAIPVGENMVYGVKLLRDNDVYVKREGKVDILLPVGQLTEVPTPPPAP